MADWLKDFMGRTPFAILGAIGLLSMASQFINLADDIENWLKVWKAVTRPVWEWIAGLIGYELPNWLKDYLTVGVIHAGMYVRTRYFERKSSVHSDLFFDREIGDHQFLTAVWVYPFYGLLWPVYFVSFLLLISIDVIDPDKSYPLSKSFSVYLETVIVFLIFVAFSGALRLAA